MTSTNDPFSQQPSEGTMRPAESSVQPHQGWNPPTTAESTAASPSTTAPDFPPAPPAPAPAAPGYSTPGYSTPGYSAPGYSAPPAPAGYGAYAPRPPKTWMNITSLVTSLLSLGLLGVIFGHLGVAAAKRGEADYKGLGIAGLILGYIGIVATIIWIALIVALIPTGTVTTG